MTIPTLCRLTWPLALSFAVAPVLGGCGSKEEIRTYTVAKEKQPQTEAPAQVGEATDRMMGAILPTGQQTWYFKVVGPQAEMDKKADQITGFFKSIRTTAGAAKPEWKAPEGWLEQAGSGMRAATLMIPVEGKPLEMSVISLPSSGAPSELLDNVNRWRGQLQMPPVDERGLAVSVKQVQVGEATMSLVDLRGKFSAGSMAPFAGGGPFAAGSGQATTPATDGRPPSTDLPAGHRPVASGGTVDQAAVTPFTFAAPEGWEQRPATGMRQAAFKVSDGAASADITVIDLPAAAPSIGDAFANVNRWRGEIGLAPIKQEELEGKVQKLEVDGNPSNYVEIIPDATQPAESQIKEATVAATVPSGEKIWFFKMRGDRGLVSAQRDNFKTFLESVRFKAADGAGDGNQ
jgi:hypothetical protein